jgi:hypothetical protein
VPAHSSGSNGDEIRDEMTLLYHYSIYSIEREDFRRIFIEYIKKSENADP